MPTVATVERDEQDALGGADVEDDPPALPARGELEGRARGRRSGSHPGRSAADPGTASGRSCSGAGRRCPASSRRPGRRCRARRRPARRVGLGSGAGTARSRRAPAGRGAGRCASADGHCRELRATPRTCPGCEGRRWPRTWTRAPRSHPSGWPGRVWLRALAAPFGSFVALGWSIGSDAEQAAYHRRMRHGERGSGFQRRSADRFIPWVVAERP